MYPCPSKNTSAQDGPTRKIVKASHELRSRIFSLSMADTAQTLAERANICSATPPTSGLSINREMPIGRCPISLRQTPGTSPHGEAGMTRSDHMTCLVRRAAAPSPRRDERRRSGRTPASPPVISHPLFGSGIRRHDDRLLAIAITLIVWPLLAALVETYHLGTAVRPQTSPSHFRTLPSVPIPKVANSSAPAFSCASHNSRGAFFSNHEALI